MPGYSNKHAKAIESQAIQVLGLAALLAALLALWPASPASASTTAPCAGDILRSDQAPAPAAPARLCLSESRGQDALRPVRSAAEPGARAGHRAFFSARIVLSPRRLAANTAPGELGVDLSETVPVAPALLVRAAWSDAAAPESQDNPFTLVGNRAGLVNATQTEVKDGQVWLTADSGGEASASPGEVQTAAP